MNDDGVANPAIDVLLGGLQQEDDLEVTVVALADERSATGDSLLVLQDDAYDLLYTATYRSDPQRTPDPLSTRRVARPRRLRC